MTEVTLPTPNGITEVKRMFGDPSHFCRSDGTLSPEWEAENIVRIRLPEPLTYIDGRTVKQIAIHRLLATTLDSVIAELHASPVLWSEVQPYGGSFDPRLKRTACEPSLHTWGIAIDLNPKKYPLGSLLRFPDPILEIFAKHGWVYGGDFAGRKDPMHFQYARGC